SPPTMVSTSLPPRDPARRDRPVPTMVPGGGRQRRWSLALLAVLVTLGSALAFVVLWMNAGDRKPVLALRNGVAAGQTIEADDLEVVRVSADPGLSLIPSSERSDVVGERAAVNLLAGTLLVEETLKTADDLDSGLAVIAIPVAKTELPAEDLETGDRVVLVRTGSGPEDPGDEIGSGRVFSVKEGDDTSTEISVSVEVAEGLAL